METLIKLISSIHWYIYLIGGFVLFMYKFLDEHIKYKENLKKNEELVKPGDFKKKAITLFVIISVISVILAIFSYIGESNFDVTFLPFYY